jgi:phage internal scaffolding protein
MEKLIKSAYDPSERCRTTNPAKGDPDRAKQEFKKDADLNVIMRRITKQNSLEGIEMHQGEYGFASPVTLHEAMNVVARAQSMFADLPGELRAHFKNEPENFLEFVQNPDNADQAQELGIPLAPQAAAEAAARAAGRSEDPGEPPPGGASPGEGPTEAPPGGSEAPAA